VRAPLTDERCPPAPSTVAGPLWKQDLGAGEEEMSAEEVSGLPLAPRGKKFAREEPPWKSTVV
jgi:hypothetical protein